MTNEAGTPGQMAICMTCQFQERILNATTGGQCTKDHPNVADDHCADYRILPGDHLGPRLAELYSYLDRVVEHMAYMQDLINLHHPSRLEEEP